MGFLGQQFVMVVAGAVELTLMVLIRALLLVQVDQVAAEQAVQLL